MKKGKAILLAILGIGVLGALNYCLPVFSFGEVLAKEGVEWYRETEVWDFDARISYEPDAQKLLELLETLPVRRNIGDNHWRGKEHQREKGPQYAIAFRYGKKGISGCNFASGRSASRVRAAAGFPILILTPI